MTTKAPVLGGAYCERIAQIVKVEEPTDTATIYRFCKPDMTLAEVSDLVDEMVRYGRLQREFTSGDVFSIREVIRYGGNR